MSDDVTRLVEAVQRLSHEDRLQVFTRLLAMLDPETDASSAWLAEVERRSDEIDRGVVDGHSWVQVRERARRFVDEER